MTNAERSKKWRVKNREKVNAYKRIYRKINPWDVKRDKDNSKKDDRFIARIRYAAISKKIDKSLKKCQICGDEKSEFHHPNYKEWYKGYHLCRHHHREVEKNDLLLKKIKINDYSYLAVWPIKNNIISRSKKLTNILLDKHFYLPYNSLYMIKKEITCYLKEVCEQKEISIYSLSKTTGIHANQIYTYSKNQAIPSMKTALVIAEAVGEDVNTIWKIK